MNGPSAVHADPARDATLTALLDVATSDAALPADAAATLTAWCDSWRPEPPPANLVARPCSLPAPRWHLDRLMLPGADAATRARRAYHARMLAHLLAPARIDLRPMVTVLIPVYNRAQMLVEAVESCLAQDWRPLEILVVDDGSTDDPDAALRRFGDVVRVHRKPNGGVASARNAGLALARGDFVHFLDSDNLLLSGAISRKLAAFRQVADADLCFCASVTERNGLRAPSRSGRPDGGELCATTDFLRAVSAHYPFLVSSVMLPRWVALQAGGFEEDLQRAEDYRYWFSLALRGAKVVGLDEPLLVRRQPETALNRLRRGDRGPEIVANLRCAADLLGRPHGWINLRNMIRRLQIDKQHGIAAASAPLVEAAISAFQAAVSRLAAGGRIGGLSPLPVLAILRHEFRHRTKRARRDAVSDPLADMAASMQHDLAPLIRAVPALTSADLAHWRMNATSIVQREPFCRLLAALDDGSHGSGASCRETTALLRLAAGIPTRRAWKRHLKLRRRIGPGAALLLQGVKVWLRRLRR